jgi:thiol-disulfide isomerase/thioredoxin
MSIRLLCATLCLAWAATNCSAAAIETPDVRDLSSRATDPFTSPGTVRVLLFVRSDCPISKRYAPELQRIAQEFENAHVQFWLVFPDASETPQDVRTLISDYKFPGTPLLDPKHELVRIAHATIAPEAAVFDRDNKLAYHGRIDDLYVDIGKSRAAATVHDLQDAIRAVVSGTAVRQAETQAVGCSLADVE